LNFVLGTLFFVIGGFNKVQSAKYKAQPYVLL